MNQPMAEAFARSLTEAVYRIRHYESKSVRAVQDELGYALGKQGGASIEHWRKGNIPSRLADVEQLAREIISRSDLDRGWLYRFLETAGYPDPDRFCDHLFGVTNESRRVQAAPPVPGLARRYMLLTDSMPFLGREQELADVQRYLRDPACRLLTLVGPGGIGKTRLAVQAAMDQAYLFPNGVFFVPLATVESPDLLLGTLAMAVGFSFYGGETAVSQLLAYLESKTQLIILDNFEHLMTDSEMSAVNLIVALISQTTGIKVLITSRERLNLRGEWVMRISGMSFPGKGDVLVEDITTYGAVQLFLQSARRAYADFQLLPTDRAHIVRICQLVEGVPLGIELAASWTRVLSCQGIAQEIERSYEFLASSWRDMPERHRSLQTVFAYSWRLLSEMEQRAMRQLAVFAGGFRREAATAVAHTSLLLLSALVDKSLLQRITTAADPSADRYEMHELLRQFAAEQLQQMPPAPSGETEKTAVSDRHVIYYADYLQERLPMFTGADSKRALAEISEEIDNVRAAWHWALHRLNLSAMARMLGPLYAYYYDVRGWWQEGAEALETAVTRLRSQLTDHSLPTNLHLGLLLGKTLTRQGHFYFRLSQYARANHLLHEALALIRPLDLPPETIDLLNLLGRIAFRLGAYDEARQYCRESLRLCRQTQNEYGMIDALEILGHRAADLGEYAEARRHHQEALEISRRLGDQRGEAATLNGLGYTGWRLGDYDAATQFCQAGLRLYQDIGDRVGTAMTMKNLGNIAADSGDMPQAERWYAEALTISQEIGFRWGEAALLNNQGNVAWTQGNSQRARDLCQASVRIWREIGYPWGIAGSLETLGSATLALGDVAGARACFREALEIAMAIQAWPLALEVLIGVAQVLAAMNYAAEGRRILAGVQAHPAIDQEGRQKVAALQAAWGVVPGETRETAVSLPDLIAEARRLL